jgi:hypothetical protein
MKTLTKDIHVHNRKNARKRFKTIVSCPNQLAVFISNGYKDPISIYHHHTNDSEEVKEIENRPNKRNTNRFVNFSIDTNECKFFFLSFFFNTILEFAN